MARAEKQREKFAKRLEKKRGETGEQPEIALEEAVQESPAIEPLALA
jgi:hypothetical protein